MSHDRDDHDDMGVLTQSGDAWTVTFTRHFAHPPDKVWRAVTEAEHLAAWFPQRIEGEWKEGATLRFLFGDGDDADGFDGELVTFDPPRRLELMWGEDRLRIEVHPDGDGTRFVLSDTFAELGKAARDGAGWHECLAALTRDVNDAPIGDGDPGWPALFERYKTVFGPDASTIGPPNGYNP